MENRKIRKKVHILESWSSSIGEWKGGGSVIDRIRQHVSIPERNEGKFFLNMILNDQEVHFSEF